MIALTLTVVLLIECGKAAVETPAAPTPIPIGTPTSEPTAMPTVIVTSAPAPTPIPPPPTTTSMEAPPPQGECAPGHTWTRPGDSMEMVYVPTGSFLMGSSPAQIDGAIALCQQYPDDYGKCEQQPFEAESPQHPVVLSGFWIDRTEVSNAQYSLCVQDGDCRRSRLAGNGAYNGDDLPVAGIPWQDAADYCAWAGGRLPSEAEWEYAARGESGYIFPWGDAFDCAGGNLWDAYTGCDDGYTSGPAPVGRFPAGISWCGALDMAGNVWEWVEDYFAPYRQEEETDPSGAKSGEERILRGGSWGYGPAFVRTAYRYAVPATADYLAVGFRCVIVPAEPPAPYLGQTPPGLTPTVFAPGIVSTADSEFAGTFSPDGTEFYFTRRPHNDSTGADSRIWFSRLEENVWTEPTYAPFTYDALEFEPHITPDGSKLFYGSRRPLPSGNQGSGRAIPWWIVERTAAGWGEPYPLDLSLQANIMYVTAANDGTIYFTDGPSINAIWRAAFVDGTYAEPERLGPEINVGTAAHPFIAPDESYLIFDSDSWQLEGQGNTDLYVSFRQADGSWTQPINMGPAINTEDGELCASVSPDGQYLFFARFIDGSADIYWVDARVIESLRP